MGIILYYIFFIAVGFAVQLLLCRKSKCTKIKWIPIYLVVAGWLFILAAFLGIFGNMGDSFYGNRFVALAFAVFFLPLTIGIIAGCVFALVWKRIGKENERQPSFNRPGLVICLQKNICGKTALRL